MKKIVLFLTFLAGIANNSNAQIELNPNSAHRLNVKAVSPGDTWGVFGTTSTANSNIVFRSGITNTNNWQNTGLITGTLGYDGTNSMGLKLASFDRDLGLYGIEKIRFGTNAITDRMIIYSNGNVGINPSLSTPFAKFNVRQTGDVTNNFGTYSANLKASVMIEGNHPTVGESSVAIGTASYGNTSTSSNIGVLGTAGNTGISNTGIFGHTIANVDGFRTFEGVRGEVVRSGANFSYGVAGKISGTGTGGMGIAVYGEASGTGGTIYAGYFSGNVINTGFTKLGFDAPKIQVVKLSGTTAATQGGYADVTHSLDISKILSIDVVVAPVSTVRHQKNWTGYGGSQFDYYYDTTKVWIYNIPGQSGSILSKPVTIYITYEE